LRVVEDIHSNSTRGRNAGQAKPGVRCGRGIPLPISAGDLSLSGVNANSIADFRFFLTEGGASKLRIQPGIQHVPHLRSAALKIEAAFSVLIVPHHDAHRANCKPIGKPQGNVQGLGRFERNRGTYSHSVAADVHCQTFKVNS